MGKVNDDIRLSIKCESILKREFQCKAQSCWVVWAAFNTFSFKMPKRIEWVFKGLLKSWEIESATMSTSRPSLYKLSWTVATIWLCPLFLKELSFMARWDIPWTGSVVSRHNHTQFTTSSVLSVRPVALCKAFHPQPPTPYHWTIGPRKATRTTERECISLSMRIYNATSVCFCSGGCSCWVDMVRVA